MVFDKAIKKSKATEAKKKYQNDGYKRTDATWLKNYNADIEKIESDIKNTNSKLNKMNGFKEDASSYDAINGLDAQLNGRKRTEYEKSKAVDRSKNSGAAGMFERKSLRTK